MPTQPDDWKKNLRTFNVYIQSIFHRLNCTFILHTRDWHKRREIRRTLGRETSPGFNKYTVRGLYDHCVFLITNSRRTYSRPAITRATNSVFISSCDHTTHDWRILYSPTHDATSFTFIHTHIEILCVRVCMAFIYMFYWLQLLLRGVHWPVVPSVFKRI